MLNVNSSCPSTTSVIEKIDKIEKLIIDEKVTLVDDKGKPLEKVESLGDYDNEDEVASWKESYENDEYDYESYDDDMYEAQEIPYKLQSICDNLDIKVRGRKRIEFYCIIVLSRSSQVVFLSPRKLFVYVTGGDMGLTLILCGAPIFFCIVLMTIHRQKPAGPLKRSPRLDNLRSTPKGACQFHRPGFSSTAIFQTGGESFSGMLLARVSLSMVHGLMCEKYL
nr:hypothetical protein [Tanacetum cinerariifolium]